METLEKVIVKTLEWITIALFIMITCVGTWQVLARYIFANPAAWTEEVLTYGFTWLALLAAVAVVSKREHMRLTFVIDKLSPKSRNILEVLNEIMMIVFAGGIFVYGGSLIMKLTFSQVTPALQISMGLFYSVLPISGVLMIILSVINIIKLSKEMKGEQTK